MVPTGKEAGASLVTLKTPQLSSVVGVPSETLAASHKPASAVIEISAGQIIVGASVSDTVTV